MAKIVYEGELGQGKVAGLPYLFKRGEPVEVQEEHIEKLISMPGYKLVSKSKSKGDE